MTFYKAPLGWRSFGLGGGVGGVCAERGGLWYLIFMAGKRFSQAVYSLLVSLNTMESRHPGRTLSRR